MLASASLLRSTSTFSQRFLRRFGTRVSPMPILVTQLERTARDRCTPRRRCLELCGAASESTTVFRVTRTSRGSATECGHRQETPRSAADKSRAGLADAATRPKPDSFVKPARTDVGERFVGRSSREQNHRSDIDDSFLPKKKKSRAHLERDGSLAH